MGSTSASVDKLTFKANKDDRRKINRLFCVGYYEDNYVIFLNISTVTYSLSGS